MKEKLKKIYKKLPIEFSFTSYKIIFIFLFPVFGVIYHRIRDKNANDNNEYFYIQLYFISYLFSLIPLIIYLIKYHNQKEKSNENLDAPQNNEESNLNQNVIQQEKEKQQKHHILIGLLIIIFLCIDAVIFRHFDFEGTTDKKTIGLVYKIPILLALSIFILKYKFYKHHYITIAINIMTLITKYSLSIIQSNAGEYIKMHIWKYFLFALSHSFLLVAGKYIMDKYIINPYILMALIGTIVTFIFISIATIKYFITSESEIFSGFTNYIVSFPTCLLFMADIISQFIYNLGAWITVYYFSPLHTIISENTIEIFYNIYDFESNKAYWEERGYEWNTWIIPSVLVINLIFSLIFNEIIILKCCKLDYYTRKRIEERERSDFTDFLNSIDKEFDDTMTSNNGEDRSSIGIIKE